MSNQQTNRLFKINLLISKYLLFSFPLIVVTTIWALITYGDGSDLQGKFQSVLWEILGWHFIIWFVSLLYFLSLLILSTVFREYILAKITRSEERDERETYISGRASKATFLLTLAIMIIFFFLSGVQLRLHNPSAEQRLAGAKGTISIGYKLELVDETAKEQTPQEGTLIHFKGIPLSKEAIIIILLLVHVGGYHFFARKRFRA